jgi:hypothetical protein
MGDHYRSFRTSLASGAARDSVGGVIVTKIMLAAECRKLCSEQANS